MYVHIKTLILAHSRQQKLYLHEAFTKWMEWHDEKTNQERETDRTNKDWQINRQPDNPTDSQPDLPGYGIRPWVISSVIIIPNDQTSDLIVNRPYIAASGDVHLMGNLAPGTIEKN